MNTFAIEQTKEETKLAVALHQNAEMNSVRLAQAQVLAKHSAGTTNEPISITFELRTQRGEISEGNLLVDVFFRMVGTKNAAKTKPKAVLSVECTFELIYTLRPNFMPSVEQINAFKDGNAIFNAWPYCRQYLQNAVVQMGYPPLTLPFLRVVTKQKRQQSRKGHDQVGR